MKSLIVPVLMLSTCSVFSQTNSNVNQEFNTLSKTGVGGTSSFQSFKSSNIDGTQFYFPDWSKGEVTTNNKETYRNNLLFIYDKVRQELFIKQKDSDLVLLGNKPDIVSFTLRNNGNDFYFINSKQYAPDLDPVFYQVLVNNPPKLTLLKLTTAKLVKSDPTDMMKERSGQVYDEFVDKLHYYLVKQNGIPIEIPLKMKTMKKILADQKISADKYLESHNGSLNEDYLIKMVTSLNE